MSARFKTQDFLQLWWVDDDMRLSSKGRTDTLTYQISIEAEVRIKSAICLIISPYFTIFFDLKFLTLNMVTDVSGRASN
jgi:hypothetical protein